MLLLSLLLRLTERPFGQCSALRRVGSAADIASLPSAIVLFADDPAQFAFAEYAIHRYGSAIAFRACGDAAAAAALGAAVPSIAAFARGKRIGEYAGGASEIAFARWCARMARGGQRAESVGCAEELRRVLEKRRNALFGVGAAAPPKGYRGDVRFYRASAAVFAALNVSVRPGYYVYRGAERQLVRADGDYRRYLRADVVDPQKANLSERRFFGALFLTPYDGRENEREVGALRRVAAEYRDEFYFAPVIGSGAEVYEMLFNVSNLEKPVFAVVETDGSAGRRWAVAGKEQMSAEHIAEFVRGISSGEMKPNHVSEKRGGANRVVFDDYEERVGKGSLVLFVRGNDEVTDYCRLALEYAEKVFGTLDCYTFNASRNDIPDNIEIREEYPFYAFYPNGKIPVYLKGEEDFEKLVRFVADKSIDHVNVEFDPKDIGVKIKNKINEKIGKEKFEKSMMEEL